MPTVWGVALAAAMMVRVKANGDQLVEQVLQLDSTGAVVPLPIDFGVATDTLYLELYATGIRGRVGRATPAGCRGCADRGGCPARRCAPPPARQRRGSLQA